MSSFQSQFVMMLLAEMDSVILEAATPLPGEIIPPFESEEIARDEFRGRCRKILLARLAAPDAPALPKPKPVKAPKAPKAAPAAAAAAEPMAGLDVAMAALSVEEKPKKPVKAPKAPKAAPPRVKMNGQLRASFKAIAKKLRVGITKETEGPLVAYLNAMSQEEYDLKKSDEHIEDFLKRLPSPAAAAPEKVMTDLTKVEFDDKEFFVDRETKRVYAWAEKDEDKEDEPYYEDPPRFDYRAKGYVGMAKFADMEL